MIVTSETSNRGYFILDQVKSKVFRNRNKIKLFVFILLVSKVITLTKYLLGKKKLVLVFWGCRGEMEEDDLLLRP